VTAVQILWINLITGITLGLALAFEPTETGTMARPPRARNAPILSGGLVWHVVLVAVLFLAAVFGIFTYAIDKGYPLALAQTMAMNTLVVLEIFHLFFIRNIHSTSLTWAAARGTRWSGPWSLPSPPRNSPSPTCRPCRQCWAQAPFR
jgi:magnesium-transporting ATPase (P-type)